MRVERAADDLLEVRPSRGSVAHEERRPAVREKLPDALDALRHVSLARRVDGEVRRGVRGQFEHRLVAVAGGEPLALVREARRVVGRLPLEREQRANQRSD